MSKIAIRYKASPSQGLGHMVRQLHLGKILQEEGHSVTYFIDDFKPSVEAKFGFNYRIINPAEIFLKKPEDHVDLLIIDQKDNNAEYIRNLRLHARKIVSFEDLGEGRHLVDLLIDCNLGEEEARLVRPGVKTLFGLPYAILHPDFEIYNQRLRQFPPTIQSALVTLGGTDPGNLTVPLVKTILKQKTSISLTVLTGPGFSDSKALEALDCKQLQVRHNISNMAETLAAHDVVFCSGGVTLHEALATGTPPIVLNQVPHQEKKAKYFENLGAAINLGLAGNWDTRLAKETLTLKKDRLETMSRIGRNLIDGKGLHRVREEIHNLLG